MSTLPGLASKGEKQKAKYQSLDINKIYRVSRGETLEKQQQKSTLTYKYGMQVLGKVPNARRPPANLPSLKSEHSGNDTVPPGGPGWGKQDLSSTPSSTQATSTTTTTNSSTIVQQSSSPQTPQLSSHQAAIALPVTTTIPPQPKQPQSTTIATPATTDKSWSAVMSGVDPLHHPPPYQSPQFQHEFPSLSSGDGGPIRGASDAPLSTPGLSLRPQTEGSWIQGGSRPGGDQQPARAPSAPLGAPPQLSAQVGHAQQQQTLPPQYRGVMPPFMYKGSVPANGSGGNNLNTNMQSPLNGRNRSEARSQSRVIDNEELLQRPIIKEEELNRMDEIERDMGWAYQDDIDYNQKLAFSDDELLGGDKKKEKTGLHKESSDKSDTESSRSSWTNARSTSMITRGRTSDDDEMRIRRTQHSKEVEIVVQRAKQRKEEEEKRFNEATKQGANKKLKELEEKMRARDQEEGVGTISPSVVPPKPITPAEKIPLPDFQKEKEIARDRESRSRTPIDSVDEKSGFSTGGTSFRQLTQIEGKTPLRKHLKGNERERDRDVREQNGPSFSRQFQNDLPPRFKRQQHNPNANAQSPMHFAEQFDNRWMSGPNKIVPGNRKLTKDSPERELEEDKREFKRQSSDESFRSLHRSQSDISRASDNRNSEESEYRHQHYDYHRRERDEEKWQKDKDVKQEKKELATSEDWHIDRREKHRDEKAYERPQRPDSRDSRASRDSRHSRDSMRDSEPRETWPETKMETTYEEKRRDYVREDRRSVPGPITKDRIEADDMKNEKRNLTQLKRGQMPDKKISEPKKEEKIETSTEEKKLDPVPPIVTKAWADAIPAAIAEEESSKCAAEKKSGQEITKTHYESDSRDSRKSEKQDDYKEREDKRRNRGYSKGWGGTNEYHRSAWSKRPPNKAPRSQRSSEQIATDSEGSFDEISTEGKDSQKSPKPPKKFEKDERNKNTKQDKKDEKHEPKKENYVPRGEPSRHGRGGGNFRSRGGLSKRIDGYGPPPSKSPFGHLEEKEKEKQSSNEAVDNKSDDKNKQPIKKEGAIGNEKDERFRSNRRYPTENRRAKSKDKPKDDACETNSDNSDDKSKKNIKQGPRGPPGSNRRNPASRPSNEKKYSSNQMPRQNSSGTLRAQTGVKKDEVAPNVANEASPKNKEESEQIEELEEKVSIQGDADGFQEVKSKKTGKERPKNDDKLPAKTPIKPEKENRNKKSTTSQLTQQQIQNIPPLMATLVNPPPVLPQSTKGQFDRPRQNKIPPRFAKLRENAKLQKAQMQQQGLCDVNDMNKVNQNMNVYNMKDQSGVVGSITNAWDKPLVSQLRSMDADSMLGVGMDTCKPLEQTSSQNSSPNDKVIGKSSQIQDKTLLDGTTPPVNTIIFENTNFKSAPGARNRNDKGRKMDDPSMDNSVMQSFNKPIGELLSKSDKQNESSIQLPLSFKEDSSDMKLDFFDSELSQLTDEKSSKNLCMPRPIITSGNSTISNADALNFKIQSVKKVWETPSEHNVVQEDTNTSFSASFVSDSNALDPSAFSKGNDTPDDNHEGYSPTPNPSASNNTPNVCKVKPTQQVAGTTGQAVLSSSAQQSHSGMVGMGGVMGNPLSPPPMQPVIGAGMGIGQPPQYTPNISYQAGLGSNNQYGMSTIPSPPTVLPPYSTQPLQPQTGVYGTFQIDQTGVLGGQSRSAQYAQYPNHYGLGQTASSPYSTQSMYLPQAQPHPPPAAQAPDLYQGINNYRLSATTPFGQNQQLNNPTTVLISSTSNSLMSASVKPSTQQISAIGTKAGGVGQAYQQQSQQGQQMYMTFDPAIQANYLQGAASVMQRGPAGPVQNNVVPAIQPSSSYYSGSTGGQSGYFQQPGNSTIQTAQLQQHQAGYGLQGSVFGNHNQTHNNAGLQSFNSHFLSTAPLQLAAALSAQQYRNSLPAQYMKSVANQSIGEQVGRPQQLKSPSSQEVLSSVFNSGPQIPSPKSRQNCKQPPPQPSPTTQHKYNLYPNVGNQGGNVQRYPTPIQRPVNYQQNVGSTQNMSCGNQKHRSSANNKVSTRQYYGNQGNTMQPQNEKNEDSKLSENGPLSNSSTPSVTSSISTKAALGSNPNVTNNTTGEAVKEIPLKEEAPILKD